jgi:hypothetical protein
MNPGYRSLLGAVLSRTSGKKKSACAIVIPCADSDRLLQSHLSSLEKQTDQDFDVIVISPRRPSVRTALNVLHFRERVMIGSSGGFGLGQVLGYALGYECIMNADADVVPYSRNLVEVLKKRALREQKALVPLFVMLETGKSSGMGNPNEYGVVTRSHVERHGFELFRLFKGAEDYEYYERLSMHSAIALEPSVQIRHKSTTVDYLSIVASKSTKFAHYKKSETISNILLANEALRLAKPLRALRYLKSAWLSAIKTQLFYPHYPEISGPVIRGAIFLDMDTVVPPRTHFAPEFEIKPGMRGFALEHRKGESPLLQSLRAAFSSADYASVTPGFIYHSSAFLPLVLMLKPVLHVDGKAYSFGMPPARIAANALFTAALCPFFLAAVALSSLSADRSMYPVRLGNLRENIGRFAAYAKKLEASRGR